MVHTLFGTPARHAILRALVFNPDRKYSVRDFHKKYGLAPASTRAELQRLVDGGLVLHAPVDGTAHYTMNVNYPLYPELRALFVKAQLMTEYDFGKHIQRLGRVAYAVLTGIFTNVPEARTDILIVGTVHRLKIRRLIRKLQREMDHDLRFTVMSRREFQYRKDITDRFLYDILENRKVVLVDTLRT